MGNKLTWARICIARASRVRHRRLNCLDHNRIGYRLPFIKILFRWQSACWGQEEVEFAPVIIVWILLYRIAISFELSLFVSIAFAFGRIPFVFDDNDNLCGIRSKFDVLVIGLPEY